MEVFLLILLFMLLIISPITLLIGLYKVLFQKEDKKFGIQLLIYSLIVLIIGFGSCIAFDVNP
ncbi:MAG: hypothetical protein ACOVLG_05985 [Flavobacterium sp.]